MCFWNRDDFHQLGSEALAGSAGGDVVGVAGDPKLIKSMPVRQWKQQPGRALSQMPATRRGVDVVADMPDVHADVVIIAEAQADGAGNSQGIGR